jgi:hypothetical protein
MGGPGSGRHKLGLGKKANTKGLPKMKSNGTRYQVTSLNKGATGTHKASYDAKSALQAAQRQRKTSHNSAKTTKVKKIY